MGCVKSVYFFGSGQRFFEGGGKGWEVPPPVARTLETPAHNCESRNEL